LAVPMAINIRDILRSGVLETLIEEGLEVHVFSPGANNQSFREEFETAGVKLHPLHPHKGGLFTAVELASMKAHALLQSLRCATLEIRLADTFRRNPLARWSRWILSRAGRPAQDRVLRFFNSLLIRLSPGSYDHVFSAYPPDLVIGTRVLSMTPPSRPEGSRALDRHLLLAAARLKHPTMVIVASWDNLTTAGFFPVELNGLTVWNEIMRDEAIEIHGMPPERIRVTGAPQHDAYADPALRVSRQEFFARYGLDTAKKLVVLTTQTKGIVPDEADLVATIATTLLETCGSRVQVMVRLHQLDDPKRYTELARIPGVVVDQAGKHTAGYDDRDFDAEAMSALVNTLRHADVVINTASSIAIDATANGTPVVCVRFDAHPDQPYGRSVRRLYDLTHLTNIVRSNGVAMADSLDQLVEQVEAFLENPDLMAEGRARLLREQCFEVDGRSAQRVAAAVLEFVGVE